MKEKFLPYVSTEIVRLWFWSEYSVEDVQNYEYPHLLRFAAQTKVVARIARHYNTRLFPIEHQRPDGSRFIKQEQVLERETRSAH